MLSQNRSSSLRSGRFCEPGRVYLVTSTTEQRRPYFMDFHIGRLVVDEFRRAENQGLAASIAWVVMPDHIHWLVELRKGSLDRLVKQVKARSAISINRLTQRTGPLWQKGFHDRALRKEEDLIRVARYIVENPKRAGLVKRVADYPLWDACWI